MKLKSSRQFLGSPVIRTPHFHYYSLVPSWGTKMQAMWHGQTEKKERKRRKPSISREFSSLEITAICAGWLWLHLKSACCVQGYDQVIKHFEHWGTRLQSWSCCHWALDGMKWLIGHTCKFQSLFLGVTKEWQGIPSIYFCFFHCETWNSFPVWSSFQHCRRN